MSKLVGLVGWRGMVGSVLMDRMIQEKDFDLIEPVFFSTSNTGGKAPAMAKNETTLQDAHNIDALKRCEIIMPVAVFQRALKFKLNIEMIFDRGLVAPGMARRPGRDRVPRRDPLEADGIPLYLRNQFVNPENHDRS